MRKLGLHVRYETSLVDMLQKAQNLGVDFFQCFLTLKTAGRLVSLETSDLENFIQLRRKHFQDIFLHISYWVNLSSIKDNEHRLLAKELSLAKKLEFTHVIIHPGSGKGSKKVSAGIDALAAMINHSITNHPDLTFVLENVAQKFPCIGGDISHFRLLLEKLDNPDKIRFCIDTAHAFSYGYDLADFKKQDEFIDFVDAQIGWSRVCLIHLNDNGGHCGSHIDTHCALGEGKIGIGALKRFVQQPKLQGIPVLLEPPVMSEESLKHELELVSGWIK